MTARKKAAPVMTQAKADAWHRVEAAILRELRKWDGIESQHDFQCCAPLVTSGLIRTIRRLVAPIPQRPRKS